MSLRCCLSAMVAMILCTIENFQCAKISGVCLSSKSLSLDGMADFPAPLVEQDGACVNRFIRWSYFIDRRDCDSGAEHKLDPFDFLPYFHVPMYLRIRSTVPSIEETHPQYMLETLLKYAVVFPRY